MCQCLKVIYVSIFVIGSSTECGEIAVLVLCQMSMYCVAVTSTEVSNTNITTCSDGESV